MDKDIFCFAVAGGSVAAAVVAARLFRLNKKQIASGLVVGLAVAALNMLVEFAGAEFDVYHVSGPWTLLRTPAPLTFAWVFLTFIFCAGYEVLVRRRKRRKQAWRFILAGIIAGCLGDWSFYRYAGILTLGGSGSWVHIFLVWLVFVPLTVFLYELVMGVLSGADGAG